MKRFSLLVVLGLLICLLIPSVVFADSVQQCPLCGKNLVYGETLNWVERVNWFGLISLDAKITCDRCGYTTERNVFGVITNPVTSEQQAEWGARSWSNYFPGIIVNVPWLKK